MDTHINAFYMDVDEKKLAVKSAKADLEEAERRLKAHPNYEEEESDDQPSSTKPTKTGVTGGANSSSSKRSVFKRRSK